VVTLKVRGPRRRGPAGARGSRAAEETRLKRSWGRGSSPSRRPVRAFRGEGELFGPGDKFERDTMARAERL
jgi:hypothetical protein